MASEFTGPSDYQASGHRLQGSGLLCRTNVLKGQSPRKWYLDRAVQESAPPTIAYSDFISREHVELLMRDKKGSALGVKFEPGRRRDAITNMEGALHTFVTPVTPGLMFGIHAWKGFHTVVRFGTDHEDQQLAMPCLLSAMIHQDFEFNNVMAEVFACDGRNTITSDGTLPAIISVEDKQNPVKRAAYDTAIKAALVCHLRESHALESVDELVARDGTWKKGKAGWTCLNSVSDAAELLEECIGTAWDEQGPDYSRTQNAFIQHRGRLISMEMLLNAASHQICNEFAAIDAICKNHKAGWIYTFNPPAIFARWWDVNGDAGGDRVSGTEFMSLVWWTALRRLNRESLLLSRDETARWGIRAIAWDDYATPGILRNALCAGSSTASPWIRAVPLSEIYNKSLRPARYPLADVYENRLFIAPRGCEEAILVLHNNSDAFGQNIETEGESGSLDGAIGANSNLAACLLRQRPDLLDKLIPTQPPLCGKVEQLFRAWKASAGVDSTYPEHANEVAV